ncbi:uncharacterized protein A1O5_00315 [Cladophialophora psammophila CBS 110553]|uniref:L-type lectin-like domain-containing protein n=1 Tax=Cladophialophora psammophila CBS 110553 TaxID=1182543 RepID=W9X6F8_9EURO|nr:uncharacterized protein A1O5_00315 [Cladophialophora psammophila CBS 110553]EXJ75808.1 hypothetical protein A1O5_00315 [Cladophialophora psammophila CBS 110553]
MRISLPSLLLSLLWVTTSLAQNVVDEMSFGHKQTISPNSFAIPGWAMLGEGHVPQLLSDKVILTPPYGGHKRGALWTEQKNSLQDWAVDFKFRASAADRGSGNLQLWYVANGDKTVSTSSIYTVGNWEGLAIVVDTVGGIQKIRGFLNDGTVDYRNHPNVDSLAFGHCDYVYRNLGRPSHINVRHTRAGGLEIRVDDKMCFTTAKITLPSDYGFGMTAASADPPDSFEVFAFTLSSITTPPSQQGTNQQTFSQNQNQGQGMMQMEDHPASYYTTAETQFANLHNRLNLISKSIQNLFAELQRVSSTLESRHAEILARMPNSQSILSLDNRMANLDRMVSSLEKELKSSDHRTQFAKLSEQIAQTHVGVTEHVPERLREYVIAHTPRIGFILYSFMAFQTCCIGAFVWYKWRKSTMPKKYL